MVCSDKAEFWEGYQACTTKQSCKYTPEKPDLRKEWARGFAAAMVEQKAGKVWWRSNTFRTAFICLAAGACVVLYGWFSGVSSDLISAGGGMNVAAILSMGLRKMLNDTPVYWSGKTNYYQGVK